MPITQERMTNLISAGRELMAHHSTLRTVASAAYSSAKALQARELITRDASREDLFLALTLLDSAFRECIDMIREREIPHKAVGVIEAEAAHFLLRKSANNRARVAMQQRRYRESDGAIAGNNWDKNGEIAFESDDDLFDEHGNIRVT